MAFFGICQQMSWNGKLFWSFPLRHSGYPFSSFVNRNNAAGYLVLCLAAAFGVAFWSWSNRGDLQAYRNYGSMRGATRRRPGRERVARPSRRSPGLRTGATPRTRGAQVSSEQGCTGQGQVLPSGMLHTLAHTQASQHAATACWWSSSTQHTQGHLPQPTRATRAPQLGCEVGHLAPGLQQPPVCAGATCMCSCPMHTATAPAAATQCGTCTSMPGTQLPHQQRTCSEAAALGLCQGAAWAQTWPHTSMMPGC